MPGVCLVYIVCWLRRRQCHEARVESAVLPCCRAMCSRIIKLICFIVLFLQINKISVNNTNDLLIVPQSLLTVWSTINKTRLYFTRSDQWGIYWPSWTRYEWTNNHTSVCLFIFTERSDDPCIYSSWHQDQFITWSLLFNLLW